MRRLFFGLDLPDDWKQTIRREQEQLQARHIEAKAWSNPTLLHVTVLFLGLVDESDMEVVCEAGRAAAQVCHSFELCTGEFGQFSRNKVFWLGLNRQNSEWAKLVQLHEMVKGQILDGLTIELDEKRYKPHITLARKLQSRVDVEKLTSPEPLSTKVTDLCLFESLREDGQLTYPVRERFPLQP